MHRFSKKRVRLFFFLCLFALAIAFFRHALICRGAELFLSKCVLQGDACSFDYANGYWQNGAYTFHKVKLSSHGKEQSRGFDATIENLSFCYFFTLFPFRFESEVVVDGPQVTLINLQKDHKKGEKNIFSLYKKHPLLKKKISFYRGKVSFASDALTAIYFSAQSDMNNPYQKQLWLAMSQEGLVNAPITADLFLKEEGVTCDLQLNQLDLPWAFQVTRFFTRLLDDNSIYLSKGTLSGNVKIQLDPKDHLFDLSYDLQSSNLTLSHLKYGLQASVDQIKALADPNRKQKTPRSGQTWPYYVGHGVFSGAKINFHPPNAQNHQSNVALEGACEISASGELFVSCTGMLSSENKSAALSLLGNGWIENDQSWKLNLDTSVQQESHKVMTTQMSLIKEKPKNYSFEMNFHNIQVPSIGLIEYLLQKEYPQLNFVSLERGGLNGSLEGKFKGGHVESVRITNFCINRALFQDNQKKHRFSADQIRANATFDFSTPHFFEKACWELIIDNGVFEGINKAQVKEIQAHLFVENSYIQPTHITGLVNGMEADVHLKGTRHDLQMHLGLDFMPEDMAYLLDKTYPQNSLPIDDRLRLDLDMHLHMAYHQMKAEGSVEITSADLSKHAIHFGAQWDEKKGVDRGLWGGVRSGWFRSACLSSDIINWPLRVLGENCGKTTGHISLEGKFQDEQLALRFCPVHFTYLSPYIYLEMDRERQTDMYCNFHYDPKQSNWKGEIPLKDVKLVEQSFGLLFETFSSKLTLVEGKLDLRDIFAISQGVTFEGNAALKYGDQTDVKLIIDTQSIQGSAQNMQSILRHFSLFKNINLPLEGDLESGRQGMHLEAYVGNRREMINWNVEMTLKNGVYPITPFCYLKDVKTQLTWSWKTKALDLLGTSARFCLRQSSKSYQLNLPIARADFKRGWWQYDIRLEAPTHDIFRIVGTAERSIGGDKKTQILIDPELTRFFGAKINVHSFMVHPKKGVEHLELETDLSARDLYHHLDFFTHLGFLPIRVTDLEEMQSPRFEGTVNLKMFLDQNGKYTNCQVKSDRFVFGNVGWAHLLICAEKKGSTIDVSHFSAGSLSIKARMEKEENCWHVPFFDVDWKNCKLRGKKGRYLKKEKKVELPLERFDIDLSQLLRFIPSLSELEKSYCQGGISTSGVVGCDFSKGIKKMKWNADLDVIGSSLSKGNIRLESEKPVHLYFSLEKGFQIKGAAFDFFHPQSDQLWAKCQLNCLSYHCKEKKWEGKGIHLVVPPEMLRYLAAQGTFPYLQEKQGSLTLCKHSFKWDNQMELTFDFTWGKQAEIKGSLKEGYYWIQDKAWHIHRCQYHLVDGKMDFQIDTDFQSHPFAINAEISFFPHLKTHLTVQSKKLQDGSIPCPLTLISDYHEEKGFFIQSIEGSLEGLDCSLHHNPRRSSFDQVALSGHIKIDMPKLVSYLPLSMKKVVQQSEMGKGYELSGDCIISKNNIFLSHFDGYLKGKRFELLGSEMETLMSEITLNMNHIKLKQFTISDVSGILAAETIDLIRGENQKWKVFIPKMDVQDFRPSLLKKVGFYQKQIKPLTIRNLHLRNLQGMLEDLQSFTGRGELSFTNTFKGDYNIFIIPFEILSRLGLDKGLLVPICGKLNYSIQQGRVYLTQLSNSHSEGKKSYFYLSPLESSYIDLNGNLSIKIKMKQHVLLKITQPFTLAIDGTVKRMRYTLQ